MTRLARLRALLATSWQVARPVLGWSLIVLGVLGCILPVLPGLPMLFGGIALVGRRTWVIRWCAVQYKLAVRRWAAMRVWTNEPSGWADQTGRTIQNRAPPVSTLLAPIVPPWRRTIACTIDSPSPLPDGSAVPVREKSTL